MARERLTALRLERIDVLRRCSLNLKIVRSIVLAMHGHIDTRRQESGNSAVTHMENETFTELIILPRTDGFALSIVCVAFRGNDSACFSSL